jgi:hypothetical protein
MRLNRRQMIAMMASATAAGALPYEASALEQQAVPAAPVRNRSDPRNIVNGSDIPRENYSDQPYVVITKDGNWLCVLTTGPGSEGIPGQHIISTISSDKGKTWSKPIDIEPQKGPEASWVMPLAIPSGRVYAFYTYNYDNLRLDTKAVNSEGFAHRVDTIGKYAFKYSDDYGKSWSTERYFIPMRKMRIDRENPYGGERMYFWGVGKPIITRHGAMFGFAKVGKWGSPGGMMMSQGCIMQSPNILTEKDPNNIHWNLLPDGDEGLRAPYGPVSDETNLVELSDGSLYATYRTIDGHNCQAYSRDAGHTWTPPAYATYADGRPLKHPRAANFVKKFSNGKYILWYHNHAGESVLTGAWDYYAWRNPAWLTGGVERDGHIYWSEPEILVYDMDPKTKISYPDFVEDGEEFYVTETMKTHARVHHIDRSLLEGLWAQAEAKSIATRGLILNADTSQLRPNSTIAMPALPSLNEGGFTVEFWVRLRELLPGQTILDARDAKGKGIAVVSSDRCTLKIVLNDGAHESSWDNDPGTHPGALRVGEWQHIAFVVDGGPKIITAIVDGTLNDGGAIRDYGWGRFNFALEDVNGSNTAKVAGNLFGELKQMRIYNRYLRTSEIIGNWRGDKA